MLTIELFGLSFCKSKHLKIGNSKLLLSLRDDLSNVEIGIGLDHAISSIGLPLIPHEILFGKIVSKLNNLKLPVVAYNDISDIQVL